MDNKDLNIENNDTEVQNKNEVRIINGEIELNIDEKKEETVESAPLEEKKESKRLLPFISNDDLFLLVAGIVLVIAAMNLDNLYNFFSKNKFQLDYTEEQSPTVNDNNGNQNVVDDSNKEYIIKCSKKNSGSVYAYDYMYIVKYKNKAYEMSYGIKSVDLDSIDDKGKYNKIVNELNKFESENYAYIINAKELNGSTIKIGEMGTFTQVIDLTVANREDINEVKEIMFFDVNDSVDTIKKNFKNEGYTCK